MPTNVCRAYLGRLSLTLCTLMLGACCSAQNVSIQTFAYSDLAQANRIRDQLRAVGFDAYSEPLPGGLTAVAIGCFSDEDAATALLADVRGRLSADATIKTLSAQMPLSVCVQRTLAFYLPPAWGVASAAADGLTLWVNALGKRFLHFDGNTWRIFQNEEAWTQGREAQAFDPAQGQAAAGSPLGASFFATRSAHAQLIRAKLDGGSLIITAGELLWQGAGRAVVRQGSAVYVVFLSRPE